MPPLAADANGALALQTMEEFQITALFAVDGERRPAAIIHIHDILGRGSATVNFD